MTVSFFTPNNLSAVTTLIAIVEYQHTDVSTHSALFIIYSDDKIKRIPLNRRYILGDCTEHITEDNNISILTV
jgi:hypothetical protein